MPSMSEQYFYRADDYCGRDNSRLLYYISLGFDSVIFLNILAITVHLVSRNSPI